MCVFSCVFVTFSWSTSELRINLVPLSMFKPSSIFHTDHSKTVLIFVDPFWYLCFVLVFVILPCLFHASLWSPAGKVLASWLTPLCVFWCVLSLSHMVSWVGCCTWLYWFLTFASALLVYIHIFLQNLPFPQILNFTQLSHVWASKRVS